LDCASLDTADLTELDLVGGAVLKAESARVVTDGFGKVYR
jgi:hypothetical protein